MKALISLAILSGLGFAVVSGVRSHDRKIGVIQAKNAYESDKASGVVQPPTVSENETKNPTADFSDLFNDDGTLKPLPEGTKVHNYWGYVRQHLSDGYLLVECGDSNAKVGTKDRVFQYSALLTRGEGANLVDGTEIRFTGIPIGVYQFEDVNHATRTIRRILYIPPEAMPKDKPTAKSAAVPQSVFPATVDTPEKRREYLQRLTEERKKRAGQQAP